MHPAASVILFTTASGAGYGLLVWLVALAAVAPASPGFAVAGLGLAFALITLGLLSSTFHLGRPERAWRALSQWRSSWLSREGVAAIATYAAAAPFALGWVFLDQILSVFAALAAAGAVATIVCTAMIYASLKPIRQWNNGWTLPVYLLLAAATGALLAVDLTLAFGLFHAAYGGAACALVVAAGFAKLAYWRAIDTEPPRSTLASATGLKAPVRLREQPQTEETFVMREMGFRVARRHARKLRRLTLVSLFALPALLMLGAAAGGGLACAAPATLCAALGVGVERWLFFAEATHASLLYYGRPA